VIERSVILCDSEVFSVDESWLSREPLQPNPPLSPSRRKLIDRQKEMIEPHWLKARAESQAVPGGSQIRNFRRPHWNPKIKALKIKKNRFKRTRSSASLLARIWQIYE